MLVFYGFNTKLLSTWKSCFYTFFINFCSAPLLFIDKCKFNVINLVPEIVHDFSSMYGVACLQNCWWKKTILCLELYQGKYLTLVLEAVFRLKWRHIYYAYRKRSSDTKIPALWCSHKYTSFFHVELAVQISPFVSTTSCPIIASTICKYRLLRLQIQVRRDITKSSLILV